MRREREKSEKRAPKIRDSNLPLKKNLNYNYRFHFLIILGSVSSELFFKFFYYFDFIQIMTTIKIRLKFI